MGEGQEIPEIRNMALSGSEPTKLEYYCRALTESCVNDFLTEIQAAPRESSPGEQPCERLCCHRRHVENWMEPWSRISLKLELAKKAVSCAQPRYYRAVGWKSQEITDCGIVLLV